MNKTIKKILLALILITLYTAVTAGGFEIPFQGQKQIGMAHIGVSTHLDASTVFFNPAGMGFLQSSTLTVGVTAATAKIHFLHQNTGLSYHNNTGVAFPFALYGVYKTAKISYGVGIFTPFGSNFSYPTNWIGKFVLQEAKLQTVIVQPSVSYKINNKLSIGSGLGIGFGNFEFTRALPITDLQANNAIANLKGNSSGITFNAGIQWQPNPNWSIGAAYRHKLNATVKKGAAKFSVPQSLKPYFPNTTLSTQLTFPSVLSIGLTHYINTKPNNFISIELNAAAWGSVKNLAFYYEKQVAFTNSLILERNYHTNLTFKIGTQIQAHPKLLLRSGVFFDTSAVPNCCITPETPDANKYALTAGFSYLPSKHLTLDFSLLGGHSFKTQTINKQANFPSTYKGNAFTIGTGINYIW